MATDSDAGNADPEVRWRALVASHLRQENLAVRRRSNVSVMSQPSLRSPIAFRVAMSSARQRIEQTMIAAALFSIDRERTSRGEACSPHLA
jgi:hypothetical protein